jgi:hypothetical protein
VEKAGAILVSRGFRIGELIKGVTSGWAKQMRREDRDAQARLNRRNALVRSRSISLQDAAFENMEAAYQKASFDGTRNLPVKPRQIYYAGRRQILERTGRSDIDGQYFSQTLLVKYVRENPEQTANWDIVWDARGHFTEPHTGRTFPLGTLEAREYLAGAKRHSVFSTALSSFGLDYPTFGPRNRFQAILFCEKEGFDPLFERTKLAQRFDLAIMSTKGMSVTAARMLIDQLCGENDIPVLIIRDFDKTGFSIAKTLVSDTPRYRFTNDIMAIDLGLRLQDVIDFQLESERVSYGKRDPRVNLRKNGATQAEIEFLCNDRDGSWEPWEGQRSELNSFTGPGLIGWIESKLIAHGIKKVIPDDATLIAAFRWMLERQAINTRLAEISSEARDASARTQLPDGLQQQIRQMLQATPDLTWDSALAAIIKQRLEIK